MKNYSRFSLYLIAYSAVALTIVFKALTIPDCRAFDQNDDKNHTFVNLFAARAIFAAGEIPQINYFNNFGTPLLQDNITFPFAPQALTYLFLDGPEAMTVNRVLIALLTLLALHFFFAFHLADRGGEQKTNQAVDPPGFDQVATPTFVLALVAFFTIDHFWHFAHHHYQMTMLFFMLALILIQRTDGVRTWKQAGLFFGLFNLFVLSASIHVVFLTLPFLVVYSYYITEDWKRTARFGLLLGLSLLPALPLLIAFFADISQSVRSTVGHWIWRPEPDLETVIKLSLGKSHDPEDWMFTFNYSFAILLFSAAGTAEYIRNKRWRKTLLVLFAGYLPIAVVVFLTVNRDIWHAIPFLKSTQIIRTFWFASLFLVLPAGEYLATLFQRSRRFELMVLLAAILALAVLDFAPDRTQYDSVYQFITLGTLLWLLPVLVLTKGNQQGIARMLCRTVGYFLLLLAVYPTMNRLLGFDEANRCNGRSHHFALRINQDNLPASLDDLVAPGSRMVSAFHTVRGHDLTSIYHGLLGGNGRSIILDRRLRTYLEDRNLIKIDNYHGDYHFEPPLDAGELEDLGVRYVLTPADTKKVFLKEPGATRTRLHSHFADYDLYELPSRPSPLYFVGNGQRLTFVHDFVFKGNKIEIHLKDIPASADHLVVTMTARRGYTIRKDGKITDPAPDERNFLKIPIDGKTRHVSVEYLAVSPLFVFLLLLAGFICLVLLYTPPGRFFFLL